VIGGGELSTEVAPMAAFKEIRDFFGEIIVPQLNELKTTLALVVRDAG
jgi:hypothetical protein